MEKQRTISDLIMEHTFFQDLPKEDISFIAGCGKNIFFKENEIIAKPGDIANEFYLIRDGKVAITLEMPPSKLFVFHTFGANEIFGLAWLIPPYRWSVSAQAVENTRVVGFNGACLREKCEKDPRLGYMLMKHLVQELVKREDAFRLHLLDVYGKR